MIVQTEPIPIHELRKSELETMAKWFEQNAIAIRYRLEYIERSEDGNKKNKKTLDEMKTIPGRMMKIILNNNMTADKAIDQIAQEISKDRTYIEANWKLFLRRTDEEAAKERRAIVMQMATQGASNDEISRRLGIHPNSISRILQKYLRTERALRLRGVAPRARKGEVAPLP